VEGIFLRGPEEAFINFERRQLIHFNKHRFLGWKKDFYDQKIVRFFPKHNLAFLHAYEKFLNIGHFESRKFNQKLQLKWTLFGDLISPQLRRPQPQWPSVRCPHRKRGRYLRDGNL
jgi:hypothetical protein